MAWRPNTVLGAIGDHEVTLVDALSHAIEQVTGVDWVVIRTHGRPENALVAELEGKVPEVIAVGDAVAVRPADRAIWDGHQAARALGRCGPVCRVRGATAVVGQKPMAGWGLPVSQPVVEPTRRLAEETHSRDGGPALLPAVAGARRRPDLTLRGHPWPPMNPGSSWNPPSQTTISRSRTLSS